MSTVHSVKSHLNRDGHLKCRVETWVVFMLGILVGVVGLSAALRMEAPVYANTSTSTEQCRYDYVHPDGSVTDVHYARCGLSWEDSFDPPKVLLAAAPPCRFEDGSGQRRCAWDARHMGNGRGDSLLIRRGGTDRATYRVISHRRAHSLIRTWRQRH
jgi:hypothetical protein